MFYPELLEVKNKGFAEELIDVIDKWLAFLPQSEKMIITASKISSKFNVDYSIAEILLLKLEELGMLKENYIIICPECEREIALADSDNLVEVMESTTFCIKCEEEIEVTKKDIYRSYELIKLPSSNEEDIKNYTRELLGVKASIQYSDDESLDRLIKDDKVDVNNFFISPLKRKKRK